LNHQMNRVNDVSDIQLQLDDSFLTSFDCGDIDELMKIDHNSKVELERKYEEATRESKKTQMENEQLKARVSEVEQAFRGLRDRYEKSKVQCEVFQKNENVLKETLNKTQKEKESLEAGYLQLKKNSQKEKETVEAAYIQLKNTAHDRIKRATEEIKRLKEELARKNFEMEQLKNQLPMNEVWKAKVFKLEAVNRSLGSQLLSKEKENIALEEMSRKMTDNANTSSML